MADPSPPRRRPINPEALAWCVAEHKLARPVRPGTKRSVSVGRGQLVPVVQAEVGAEVPIEAYLYRLFVPVAYFSALRRELQEALGEGVILVQRSAATLIGSLVPAQPTPSPP